MKTTWARIVGIASLALLPPAVHAQPPQTSTAELVTKLGSLPDWLDKFEAIVGPLHRKLEVWDEAIGPLHRNFAEGPIEHIDVAFSIDMYHFDPQKMTNVQLDNWQVLFRGDQDAAAALLKQRFGDGELLDFADGSPRRFGPLYLTPLQRGGFELAWYQNEPQWAVRRRTPAEDRALEDRLMAFLRAGIRDQTVEQFFPGLAKRVGWSTLESHGPHWRAEISPGENGRPSWVSIKIRGEVLDATRLVGALGMKDPGFLASDVHMSYLELSDLTDGRKAIVDGYQVNVHLDRDQVEPTTAKRPGQGAWKAKAWRIRSLWLNPADKP